MNRRRPVRTVLGWLPRAPVMAAVACVLAGSGAIGYMVWSRTRGPTPAELRAEREHRARAAVPSMAAFANQMCQCTDKPCADAVDQRVTAWTRDDEVRWHGEPMVQPFDRPLATLRELLRSCRSRAMTPVAPVARPVAVEPTKKIDPGNPALGGATLVKLSRTLPIDEAILEIAAACNVNVVMGRIAGDIYVDLANVRCDDAFRIVVDRVGLAYGQVGTFVRIARGNDLAMDRGRALGRESHGIVQDPLPEPEAVVLDDRRAPVRDVIRRLATAAHVSVVVPRSIDGVISAHTPRPVPWERAFLAILETSGLGYRYDADRKRLRIAPIDELDAERVRALPQKGTLKLINLRGRARVTIDGRDTGLETPIPGGKLELAAGSHTVVLTEPNGDTSTSRVYIPAGGSATIQHEYLK